MNPDFPTTRKVSKKSEKSVKKSAGKMVIAELGKRVEKHDLIHNLAQAQAGITFGHIARGDIDFAKNELQRIFSGKLGRAVVNFAAKDEDCGVSILKHLLVRVEVCSKFMMALFDSGSVPNFMLRKMVSKLHMRMKPTNCTIKVANCASEKYVGTLDEVSISMGVGRAYGFFSARGDSI